MSLAGGYDQHEFVAAFYDHVVPYRSRPDVTFFVDAARESGGRVLEVGCGTGRILIPTARAGVEVMGMDFSSHMLAVCRARAGTRAGSCGIGSWGGRCLSMGNYVTGLGATRGAGGAGGR